MEDPMAEKSTKTTKNAAVKSKASTKVSAKASTKAASRAATAKTALENTSAAKVSKSSSTKKNALPLADTTPEITLAGLEPEGTEVKRKRKANSNDQPKTKTARKSTKDTAPKAKADSEEKAVAKEVVKTKRKASVMTDNEDDSFISDAESASNAHEKATGNQSLFRGLTLLELLSDFPNGCALQKLAQLASLNKSTVHRMLQCLESAGYVTHGEISGSYRLTSKCAAIGHKSLSSLNILSVAAPHLNALNYETGETINFSMREDDHVILIYKLEPIMGMMRTRAYLGQHMCLHNSAMGKIFMAFGAEDYPKQYWETHGDVIVPLTANTIVDLDKMYEELATIRQRHISYDNEENEMGVFCIAAPVFDIHERVAYSVSISLSTSRLKQVGKDNLIKALKETAKAISRELGYGYDKKK